MFTRTNAGLSSEHLFHGVDIVVYCEGKESEGEASSLDEVFWHRVFSQNGKIIRCKSMGSKNTLLSLAQKIIDNNIGSVVVAMDRDYDDLLSKLIVHPQVIYTYGYSWESDVVLDFDLNTAVSLFASTNHRQAIYNDLVDFRERQSKKLRRVAALDYKYIGSPESLFDRGKPFSIISFGGSEEPRIKIENLLKKAKEIGRFQTATFPENDYRELCGLRAFYGKTVARLFYHWFNFRTKKIRSYRRANFDVFMNLLSSTLDLNKAGVSRNEYYVDKISSL